MKACRCIYLFPVTGIRERYFRNLKIRCYFSGFKFFEICDLVKLKTCEVMYRVFNKTLPVNLNNIFTVCEPNCLFNMRKKDFVQKYTLTNLEAMSVSVVGAKLWNDLDNKIIYET